MYRSAIKDLIYTNNGVTVIIHTLQHFTHFITTTITTSSNTSSFSTSPEDGVAGANRLIECMKTVPEMCKLLYSLSVYTHSDSIGDSAGKIYSNSFINSTLVCP